MSGHLPDFLVLAVLCDRSSSPASYWCVLGERDYFTLLLVVIPSIAREKQSPLMELDNVNRWPNSMPTGIPSLWCEEEGNFIYAKQVNCNIARV